MCYYSPINFLIILFSNEIMLHVSFKKRKKTPYQTELSDKSVCIQHVDRGFRMKGFFYLFIEFNIEITHAI